MKDNTMHETKLGSHNSLSGYRPLKRWMYPLNLFAKCQSKRLYSQYADGVSFFDLRFAKHEGKWYGAHGAILYNITLEDVFEILGFLPNIHARVLCEDTFYKSDADELSKLVDRYKGNVNVLYVRSKKTWNAAKEYPCNKEFHDINLCWNIPIYRIGDAKSIIWKYNNAITGTAFVGCYSSTFIPMITAKILNKVVRRREWKENEVPMIDFV